MKIRVLFSQVVIAIVLVSPGTTSGGMIDEVGDLNIINDAGNSSDGLRYLDLTYSDGMTKASALANAQATYSNARLATASEWDDLFAAAGIIYTGSLTASDAFTADAGPFIQLNGLPGVVLQANAPAVNIVRLALGPTNGDTRIFSDPDGNVGTGSTRDFMILSNDDLSAYQSPIAATGSDPGIGWLIVSDAANPVPEPSSIALLGMGAISLIGFGWRRKRKQLAV